MQVILSFLIGFAGELEKGFEGAIGVELSGLESKIGVRGDVFLLAQAIIWLVPSLPLFIFLQAFLIGFLA